MPDVAYIALGSNLGDRRANLALARHELNQLRTSRLVAESAIEETEALTTQGEPQPPYLNQMVALETSLTPHVLLRELQCIEDRAGRTRGRRWAARTLDLDIVLFGSLRMNDEVLTIPHPELPNRDFWRRELQDMGVACE